MFVILVYDVNSKRVSRMRKTAEKYLKPMQKSVFEGVLSDRAFGKMQKEIEKIIDFETDSVIIYKHLYGGSLVRCSLGRKSSPEGPIL